MSRNGDRTEGAILGALLHAGCCVLIPYGQGHAYDLVVDRGAGGFARIQCKTAWESGGCLEFNSASTDHGHGHRHYRGRAEYFGVWLPSRDLKLLVPVERAARRRTYLRLRPAANNQVRRTLQADEFRLERSVGELLPREEEGASVLPTA